MLRAWLSQAFLAFRSCPQYHVVFYLFVLMLWYWNKVWYDMVWYGMANSWIPPQRNVLTNNSPPSHTHTHTHTHKTKIKTKTKKWCCHCAWVKFWLWDWWQWNDNTWFHCVWHFNGSQLAKLEKSIPLMLLTWNL